MLIRTLIRHPHRARRRLKHLAARRYTWAMTDLFAVPAGTVPQVDPEHGEDHSGSFPAEMEDYLGKWVAVRDEEIIAVADTEADVRKALGEDALGFTLFHVPSSVVAAR
jgi:hypothetical protein